MLSIPQNSHRFLHENFQSLDDSKPNRVPDLNPCKDENFKNKATQKTSRSLLSDQFFI